MSEYKDYGYTNAGLGHVHDYILKPVISNLNTEQNKCILDLGCGNGALVNKLVEHRFNAYGTDASVQGINIAKQSHPERFTLQDLTSPEIPEQFKGLDFDTIISTEVIEHLYDPRGFILYCKKILKKDGEIILTTPYHGYLKNLMIGLSGKWDSHANPLWDGGHIKLWSRETLTQLLQEGGFEVTKFIGCGRFPYFWKSMLIKGKLVNV